MRFVLALIVAVLTAGCVQQQAPPPVAIAQPVYITQPPVVVTRTFVVREPAPPPRVERTTVYVEKPVPAPARDPEVERKVDPPKSAPIKVALAPLRAPVTGSCDCPYDFAKDGSRCGRRSAYDRPGGRAPVCYR